MDEKYYHTKESVQEYINLAKDFNGSKLIEKLGPLLEDNSSILEIGTGPGDDWKLLSRNHNVVGSDNSVEFLKHLQKQNPKGEFIELDAVTLNVTALFQALYSNKVLHHLTDDELKKSIARQSEVLEPGGLICHSFWKGGGTEIFKGLFVNYHTEKELSGAFEGSFEILLLEAYQEFEADDSILLIGKKKA